VSAVECHFDVVVPESSFFALDSIEDIVGHVTARGDEASRNGAVAPSPREPHAAAPPAKTVLPAFSSMRWENEDD
jgi:hypothetical protein